MRSEYTFPQKIKVQASRDMMPPRLVAVDIARSEGLGSEGELVAEYVLNRVYRLKLVEEDVEF